MTQKDLSMLEAGLPFESYFIPTVSYTDRYGVS